MQQSRGLQRILHALAPVLLLVLAACGRDAPEQAVRSQVEAMQLAIDERDAGAIDELLADDFIGNEGAKVGPVSVELRGETDALARFSVLATGGSGGLLPDSGQLYQVETGWRLVDGEWKLLSASWKPNL